MLLFLSEIHKEHVQLLQSQPSQVVINFGKLAIDYLNNGINAEKHKTFADKLKVNQSSVKECIEAIVYLLSQGCKHNLSDADFKASLSMVEFSSESLEILTKLFNMKKADISEALNRLLVNSLSYQSLNWRIIIQIMSRSSKLLNVQPMVTLDLVLATPKLPDDSTSTKSTDIQEEYKLSEDMFSHDLETIEQIKHSDSASKCKNSISHVILEIDLPNLKNLTNVLSQALKVSKSQHIRQVQRAVQL